MKSNQDYFLVSIPQRYADTILSPTTNQPLTGLNGELLVNPQAGENWEETLGEQANKVRKGTIVSLAPHLSQEWAGMQWLQEGDKVYVENHAVDDANMVSDGLYAVTPANLICFLLDRGENTTQYPIPLGGFVLCWPTYPVDAVEEVIDGKKMWVRLNSLNMVVQTNVQALEGQGRVAWVGMPDSTPRFAVGQRVLFDMWHGGVKNLIEGTEYICIREEHIAAILDESTNLHSKGESRLGQKDVTF